MTYTHAKGSGICDATGMESVAARCRSLRIFVRFGKGVGVRSKCYTCQSAVRCVYDMRHYANLHFKFAVKRGVPDTHNALKAVCVFGSWCA